MITNIRRFTVFLLLAGLGTQSAHAHGGTDLIPPLLALPLGQILSLALLITFAIKLRQGLTIYLIIASGSVATTILVWLFHFPFINFFVPFHPNSILSFRFFSFCMASPFHPLEDLLSAEYGNG